MARLLVGATIGLMVGGAALAADGPGSGGDRAAVIATVQGLFDAMAAKDADKAASLLIDQGTGLSLGHDAEGKPSLRRSENRDFSAALNEAKADYLERIWDAKVTVAGDIAVLWAPYDFHLNGEFHHCGIDLMQLFRIDGAWKIGNFSWTNEGKSCPPSPLGPPQ